MSEFTIAEIPAARRNYDEIKKALLGLPAGKALVVPHNTFGRNPVSATLRMDRHGFRVHVRTLPEGIHVWLEPIEHIGGAQ